MKITERHLTHLRALLPTWKFEVTDSGWLWFRAQPHGRWANVSDPWDEDHLCGEIQRALLRQEDFSFLRVSIGTDCLVEFIRTVGETGGWYSCRGDDLLTALLEATALYFEASKDRAEGGAK